MRGQNPSWLWMDEVSQMSTAGQATERVKVRDLTPGMKVRLYRTVVEILGPWFVPEGEGLAGFGRLPMKWDGLECAPPEPGDKLVEVVPDGVPGN